MAFAKVVINQAGAIREFEKPEVCEAIKVANANRWTVGLSPIEWDDREARLKKEYEKNTKAPGSGGDQPKEGNPALAESASQFNDALLDEQAKKIAELTEEKERLEDKITIFNIFKKRNDESYRRQIRSLDKEISKLNGIIHDKNAVLSDVAEELRLSKIREKNLTEVCQKYMKEVEDLKKELADKVVDKIDAQALKSAESALAYKEKVIADLTKKLKSINMNRHNERIYKKQLAEKDDVIADLGKELTESKKRVEWVRNASKEYCDYGVAANEFIKELAHLYVLASNNGNIDVEMLERCKNYQTYGFPANCNRETKKEINDIARGKTKVVGVDIAEEGEDYYGKIVLCDKICTRKIEEIEIEKAVKLVRKAMKEGHTVTINYKD